MLLTDTLKNQIKKHALNHVNEEMCGLIVNNGHEIISFPCTNIHKNKKDYFRISPVDYLHATKLGKIIGSYHSQIDNADFTQFDYAQAKHHDLIYVMYCISTDTFQEFDPRIDKFDLSSFIGRQYLKNKYNCFELVKDYYKQKFNFLFADYSFDSKWYESEKFNFVNELKNKYNNFFTIVETPKEHDILFLSKKKTSNPHHLGIYINKLEFLHHPENKVSRIDEYNDTYKKMTQVIIRYNERISNPQ